MKTILRKFTSGLLCVALGAGIYLSLPTIERLLSGDASPRGRLTPAQGEPLAQVEVLGAEGVGAGGSGARGAVQGNGAGNTVLHACQVALERRTSVRVDLLQSGTLAGQIMETSGVYLQRGQGVDRRFSLLLQGRVGSTTSRIWQVCDGRFLFSDLAWQPRATSAGAPPAPGRRSVNRIDLAMVRRRLGGAGPVVGPVAGSAAGPQPGAATAEVLQPGFWTGQGGMPMLLGALGENYNFGTPRQMMLRNQRVFAMIGRWKPACRDKLLTPKPRKDAPADAPPPKPVAPPERMPHHVLVAIGVDDRFPYLIEYRAPSDRLSAAGLTDDQRLQESRSPMLRLDLLSPRFGEAISDEYFVYREPEGVDFRDTTEDRLRLVDARRSTITTARAGARRR